MVRFLKSRGISMIDMLNLSMLFVIFIFFLYSIPDNPYFFKPLLVLASAWTAVWVAVLGRRTTFENKVTEKIRKFFINFYPIIFMFIMFESFFMILPYFNPKDYDAELANLDYRLLGVHPTVWIEQFASPLLTDLMYSLYFFYFPFQFIILFYLYNKKRFAELDKSVFILLFINYGAYIGYFIFPAMGPRFYEPLMHLQTKTLNGYILAEPIKAIIAFFEPNKFDAFPSLHTAISLSTLILMAKYNRKMFYIFIPVVIGIWIAIIYCRYHYVVDMIAGVLWTIFSFVVIGLLYDRWAKTNLFHYKTPKL
ncbi:MAG: phosphatase PAP2 family protein [Bacteroidales bacterium]|nr:phosphatase PAP2 family protein [Bacteroidales bacterium]